MGKRAAALTLLAATLAAPRAWAADPAAEALYQEGRRALAANDLALACRKLAESQAREPAPGTLLNLGDCEERRGHLVVARESFEQAVALFPPNDTRLPYAKERFERVDKRVARLTIHVRGGVPEGARLTIDGTPANAETLIRVESGAHVVTLESPGRSSTTKSIELAEGESRDVDLAEDGASSSKTTEAPAASRQTSPLAWGAFGLAAAALVVGTYAGIRTLDAKSTVDDNCRPACNPVGAEAQSDGKTFSAVSTVGFVVAGAAIAAGVVFLVLGKTPAKAQALVAPLTF